MGESDYRNDYSVHYSTHYCLYLRLMRNNSDIRILTQRRKNCKSENIKSKRLFLWYSGVMKKIKTLDVEIAVSEYFNPRQNLPIPNVSWGMFIHECDLFILTSSGYGYEVEIKVSRQDLIKDKEKRHGHKDERIKFLYFAIPHYLKKDIEHIPERAGILIVNDEKDRTVPRVECLRKPKQNGSYKFTLEERFQLARLGALRILGLKRKIKEQIEWKHINKENMV